MHVNSLPARLVMAVGMSVLLIAGSLPGVVSADLSDGSQRGQIDDNVLTEASASSTGTIRVIIVRDRSGSDDGDVRDLGGRVAQKLDIGNATAAEIPVGKLSALAAKPGVVRVSYDAPVTIQADPLTNCCDRLQSAYPVAVGATDPWTSNVRGTGVGVAVIDSGVRSTHPDFQGGNLQVRVPYMSMNITGATTTSGVDDNGHGTFVAGIIAGRGWGLPLLNNTGKYIGTAPDTNIISLKVSDSTGLAHVSDVVAAIQWVARNRQTYNIRVLNLSMVSNVASSYKTDMLDAAVELAWLQGVVIVVAAGNAGANAQLTSPANDPYVITVGATDDMGTATTLDDRLAWFSSYGTTVDGFSKPDLVAPGRNIVSLMSSRTDTIPVQFPTRIVDDTYIRLSGTSASAPVVTGVIADLLQARPTLTPGQVKWLLKNTAVAVPGPGTGAGYPRLDKALDYAGPIPNANAGLVPNNYLASAYASQNGLTSRDNVAWDNISWNTISWNTISWNTISWNCISWNSVTFLATNN